MKPFSCVVMKPFIGKQINSPASHILLPDIEEQIPQPSNEVATFQQQQLPDEPETQETDGRYFCFNQI